MRNAMQTMASPLVWCAVILVAVILVAVTLVAVTPRGAAADDAVQLSVYAAASLRDVLEALAPACEESTGTRLTFNFAGTSTLARQITAAHHADIFVAADEDWMNVVDRAGLVDRTTRVPLLSNSLAVIGADDSTLTIDSASDLTGPSVTRLALALPDAVPAGRYARGWLEQAGIWEEMAGRVVPVVDVRAALTAVASGLVPVGVVYRTDAALSSAVRVLFEVPPAEGPRIVYPAAVMRDRPHAGRAKKMLACLAGNEARAVFQRFGFTQP